MIAYFERGRGGKRKVDQDSSIAMMLTRIRKRRAVCECLCESESILFATVSKRLHSCSLLPGMQQVARGEKVNSHDGG